MSFYIVCHQKRNNPRMDVRICQRKCDLKDDCEDYVSFHKVEARNKDRLLSTDSRSLHLNAA